MRASTDLARKHNVSANGPVDPANLGSRPIRTPSNEGTNTSPCTPEEAIARVLAALRQLPLEQQDEFFSPKEDDDASNPRWAAFDSLVSDIHSSPDAGVAAIMLLAGPLSADERRFLERAFFSRPPGRAQGAVLPALLDLAPRLADSVSRRSMFKVLRWWFPNDWEGANPLTAQVLSWYKSEKDSRLRENLLDFAAPYARHDEVVLDLLIDVARSDKHDRTQELADSHLSSMAAHETPGGRRAFDAVVPILLDSREDPRRRYLLLMTIASSLKHARNPSAHLHDQLVPWASRVVRDEGEPLGLRIQALGLLGHTNDAQAIQGALALLPSAAAQRASGIVLSMMSAEFSPSRQLTDVLLSIAANPPPDLADKYIVSVLGHNGDERALPILQRIGGGGDAMLRLSAESAIKQIKARAAGETSPK